MPDDYADPKSESGSSSNDEDFSSFSQTSEPGDSSSGDYDEDRPRPEEKHFEEEESSNEEASETSTEHAERLREDPNGVEPKKERKERKLEVERCLKEGSTRLFIRNMNHAATDSDLRTFLNKCGKVKDTFWCMNKETGTSYGTAFVEMSNVAGAAAALSVHPVKYGVIGPKTKIRLAKNIAKAGRSAQVPSHHVNKPRFTVFVSGLNPAVTPEALRKHFTGCGRIDDVKIHNAGKTAFVTFVDAAARDKALNPKFPTKTEDGITLKVALPRGPSPQPSPVAAKK